MAQNPRKLRSTEWFGKADKDGFGHRSWMKNQGFPGDLFDGRPVIGICNTWSELTPCNAHFRKIAEHVKRGVYEAGGFPLEFPVISLGETQPAADRDAVPQPRQHGRRGVDPRQSDRRRRAAGRLRQDDAGAADGRGELRPADHRALRRADAQRQVPRPGHRLRHRHLEVQRDGAGRRDDPRRLHGRRAGQFALGRALHDHGHRLDHGLAWSRRSAWACPATPRSPRSMRGATCSPISSAAASSRWCARTCACRRS